MNPLNSIRIFEVAGFRFRVMARSLLLDEMANLRPFQLSGTAGQEDALLFSLEQEDALSFPSGEPLFCTQDGPGFPEIALWEESQGYFFRMRPLPGAPVAAFLRTSRDFVEARVFLSGADNRFGLNNSLMLLFAFATARRGALEMHASVVMQGGKGYLFLGRSGTGKSTHSRLWMENIPGTELLNDDNPILRRMPDGTARVYGSPWSGKTPCYKAQDVPVGAVVRLSQAPENAISRLSVLEAYASLMASASAFRPFRELAEGWHCTLEGLASALPCYHLKCRPDKEAAQLCYMTINSQ